MEKVYPLKNHRGRLGVRRGNRTKLAKYTERCLNALDLSDMPPVVYVPYGLRREVRLAWDGSVTKAPPDAKENLLRVSRSDPLGLLVAMMQGQPVPTYRVTKDAEGKFSVQTDLEVPTLELRAHIAEEVIRIYGKSVGRGTAPSDYDVMIERMAEETPNAKPE